MEFQSQNSISPFQFSSSGSPQIEYWLRFLSTTPFWQHQSQPEIEGNWWEGSNLPKFLTTKMGFCTTVHSLFNINFVIMWTVSIYFCQNLFYQTCLFITIKNDYIPSTYHSPFSLLYLNCTGTDWACLWRALTKPSRKISKKLL